MRQQLSRWRVAGVVAGVLAVGLPVAARPGQDVPKAPEPAPVVTVCAPGLRGVVQLPPAVTTVARRATVELLTGPQQTVLFTVKADRSGRFQLGGGLVKKGTEWLVRVTAPGVETVTVRLRIDPACKEPVLPLSAAK
jgi:hypothetical protein